ncbi:DUF4369 domain-containing protein [Arachidicoccus sp.]|jgi:hypothetical protein|uniref:DUF4369 domain-containing protein n=1 Tax=Arachidicoccus sp. TaxID=1872624 RepID=UPI003D1FC962
MKFFSILLLVIFPMIAFPQKENVVPFKLIARVNFPSYDATGRCVYFQYQLEGKTIIDSVIIKNNLFSFSGKADVTVKAALQFTRPNSSPEPESDPNLLSLYLSKGIINIHAEGNLGRAIVTGSHIQKEYIAFKKKYIKIDRFVRVMGWHKRGLNTKDSLSLQSINSRIDSAQQVKRNDLANFLDKNIKKPYAVEAILMYLKAGATAKDAPKAEHYFNAVSEDEKLSTDGRAVTKILNEFKGEDYSH